MRDFFLSSGNLREWSSRIWIQFEPILRLEAAERQEESNRCALLAGQVHNAICYCGMEEAPLSLCVPASELKLGPS